MCWWGGHRRTTEDQKRGPGANFSADSGECITRRGNFALSRCNHGCTVTPCDSTSQGVEKLKFDDAYLFATAVRGDAGDGGGDIGAWIGHNAAASVTKPGPGAFSGVCANMNKHRAQTLVAVILLHPLVSECLSSGRTQAQ